MRILFQIVLSGFLVLSCTDKENTKYDWSSAMSAPGNYPAGNPKIYYFYKGKPVSGSASLTSTALGWGYPSGGMSMGERYKPIPDSVAVSWRCSVELLQYEGSARLPHDKIKKLFEEGYVANGKKELYLYITTGMAPGGTVCVWVDHVEVARFKAKNIGKNDLGVTLYEAKGEDAKYDLEYNKYHPIDYSYWEKPDKRYELDFGFCSENTDTKYRVIYAFSKEGIRDVIVDAYIDITEWGKPFGEKPDLSNNSYIQLGEDKDDKMTLPVHIHTMWENSKGYYLTDVVMPKDLPQRFEKTYTNPETGKLAHYNRIVLGVEKDGKHAILWLDGPGKQEKIMRFKGYLNNIPDNNSGGYAEEVVYY